MGVDVWDNLRWAIDSASDMQPDLVVVTGDLALNWGTEEIYRAAASAFQRFGANVLYTPGNHDDRSLFREVFGRRYQLSEAHPWIDLSVEVAGIGQVLLDSGDASVSEQQLRWLDAVLHSRASAARRGESTTNTMVWTHYPLIKGFHRYMDANWSLANGSAVLDLLERYTGDLDISVFSGHYHCEHAELTSGVRHYVTPATYLQIDPSATDLQYSTLGPGFRLVDVSPVQHPETAVVYRNRDGR